MDYGENLQFLDLGSGVVIKMEGSLVFRPCSNSTKNPAE